MAISREAAQNSPRSTSEEVADTLVIESISASTAFLVAILDMSSSFGVLLAAAREKVVADGELSESTFASLF
jgi:hypothetical protein